MMMEPDDGTLERQEEDTTAVEEHQTSIKDDSSLARGRKSYSIATKLRVLSKYSETCTKRPPVGPRGIDRLGQMVA